MLNAAVFTFIAVMCISSYHRAIYTDPGRVPRSFVPDVEDADSPIHEIKRKVYHSFSVFSHRNAPACVFAAFLS